MAPYFEIHGDPSGDKPIIGRKLPQSENCGKALIGENIVLSSSKNWPYVDVSVRIISDNKAKVTVVTNDFPDRPVLIEKIKNEVYCGAQSDKINIPAKKVKRETFIVDKRSIFSDSQTWVEWRSKL
jgi:hypothetical protein